MSSSDGNTLLPYLQIARVDHWFKNAFMLLGVLLGLVHAPELAQWSIVPTLLLAGALSCIVSSSNYVLNEVLDGPTDGEHPVKRHRPVPSGRVRRPAALALWLVLGAGGIGLGLLINAPFALAAAALWLMGVVYNVPPLRSKEVPYVDVLSESVNNPIRLLLGWFPLIPDRVPPLSLMLAYWMVGAFFMATKRFAEYRRIDDPAVAGRYRKSFRHYTEERLLVSMLFYVTACAFFGGVFIVRNRVELILFVPLAAGFLAWYLKLGLEPDSPVQNPESLHRRRGFLAYTLLCGAALTALMFVEVPAIRDVFDLGPPDTPSLWRLGR